MDVLTAPGRSVVAVRAAAMGDSAENDKEKRGKSKKELREERKSRKRRKEADQLSPYVKTDVDPATLWEQKDVIGDGSFGKVWRVRLRSAGRVVHAGLSAAAPSSPTLTVPAIPGHASRHEAGCRAEDHQH